MARPSAVQTYTTDNYVSTLDIHEPAVKAVLVKRFAGKNLLEFFKQTGAEEAVSQTSFSHHEEENIHEYFTVSADVADPGAGNPLTFTIAAGDHYNSGAYSIGQQNQLVLLANDQRAFIYNKNTGTAGAHTVTLYPLNTSVTLGALKANDVIIIYSNAYGEGTGQPDSEESRTIKLSFTHQIIKRSYRVTGTEATNRVWFKVKGKNGKTGFLWYLKGEADTSDKFDVDVELAMLIGDLTTNATLTGQGIRTMQGLIPFISQNGGITHRTGGPGMWSYPQLQSLIRKLNKNYGAKENTVWMGLPLRQDTQNFIGSIVQNGAVTYGAFNGNKEMAISFGFSSIHDSGYTFHFKQYDMFDHPKLLGAPGYSYGYTGLVIPDDKIKDQASSNEFKALTMCYKGADDYKRDMVHWLTGGAIISDKTGEVDEMKSNYLCERSLRVAAPNKFAIIKP